MSILKRYVSFDPNVEIIGQNVLGYLECINRENVLPFLQQRGLDNIDPQKWYPLQDWLDVLNDLENQSGGGAMMDFVSIGMKIAELAQFPPEFDQLPFDELLAVNDRAYQMQHRNGDAGYQTTEKISEGHVTITLKTPYPDDLAYGVVWGECKRFLPAGTNFTVFYDESAPRHDDGGDVTVIHIKWDV